MNRIESVDAIRFAAIAGVIAIHTHPYDTHPGTAAVVIDQASRFAVPFFFAISGYFWGLKIRRGASAIEASVPMAKRILFLFIAWSGIYLFPFSQLHDMQGEVSALVRAAYWNVEPMLHSPLTLALEGTSIHLWFLPGLLCALVITAFFVNAKKILPFILLAIFLYCAGLLAKAYSGSQLGLHIAFNTRDGPFFGTLFFASGYLLSGLKPDEKWLAKGLMLFLAGYALQLLEIYFLSEHYGETPFQDYVAGTYFTGMGATIAALSNHPALRLGILSSLGRLTLGIYAAHFAFVDMLRQSFKTGNLPWGGYFLAVLILSVSTAMILSRQSFTRRLVA